MRNRALGILVGLAAVAGTANAGYGLGTPDNYPVEGDVWRVGVGDVTGDHRNDVLALSRRDGISKLLVYTQKIDGTLTSPPRVYSLPANSLSLALADLNRDGIQDVVVGGSESITILTSNRVAPVPLQMRSWTTTQVSAQIRVTTTARGNRLDIVSVNGMAFPLTSPVVFHGDGMGGINPNPTPASMVNPASDLEVGKIDGDAMTDMVTTGFDDATIKLLYNNLAGTFTTPEVTIDPGFLVEEAILGDFNDDGRTDLVAAGATTGPTYLYLYKQQTSGEPFPQAESFASAPLLASLDALLGGDLDGDGRDDLLVAHRGQLGLYLQGDSGLGSEVLYPARGNESTGLAAGDVNGDGCKDVVVSDYYTDVNVYYGQDCASPTPPSEPLPDLRVAVAATSSSVAVTLSTIPGNTAIQQPLVGIDLAVRSGTLELGTLPANCVVQLQIATMRRIDCLMDTLAPGASATLNFPLSVSAQLGTRKSLGVVAHAATDTPEQTQANNVASSRFFIEAQAAAAISQPAVLQVPVRSVSAARETRAATRKGATAENARSATRVSTQGLPVAPPKRRATR